MLWLGSTNGRKQDATRHRQAIQTLFLALLLAGGVAALCAKASLAAFNRTPATAAVQSRVVSTSKCTTVAVTDNSGNAATGGYVSLTLKAQGGSAVLAKSYGLAASAGLQICYGGATLPGALDISGFVDTNGNGSQDAGEPTISGTA
jgi:hypothetical protein